MRKHPCVFSPENSGPDTTPHTPLFLCSGRRRAPLASPPRSAPRSVASLPSTLPPRAPLSSASRAPSLPSTKKIGLLVQAGDELPDPVVAIHLQSPGGGGEEGHLVVGAAVQADSSQLGQNSHRRCKDPRILFPFPTFDVVWLADACLWLVRRWMN